MRHIHSGLYKLKRTAIDPRLSLILLPVMFLPMTSLLELPDVRERMHRMTVQDYHRAGEIGVLSEDVELLRGFVVTKMPKSPLHEFVSQNLMECLLAQLPAGFKVRPKRPLTLRDSEPEPDLSVVRGKTEDWISSHPSTADLVIEVAISSSAIDESKAQIYAEAGIPEYRLIRPEERTADVFRQPSGNKYLSKTSLTERDVLRPATIPGIKIPLKSILPATGP